MSEFEPNVLATPWIGRTSCKNAIAVVVLSTDVGIIDRICQALGKIHAKGDYQWKLIIIRSFHLEEIVRQFDLTGPIAMDFIVIGLDTSKIICLDWAKKVVDQVHPDLRRRRMVLVNASGLPINRMAVSANELMKLQNEWKMEILTSNVHQEEDANFLARRLLKYIEISLGVKTGLPYLDI